MTVFGRLSLRGTIATKQSVLDFEHLNFDIVSSFDIRISDLIIEMLKQVQHDNLEP